jgi:hypothetical protein
MGTTVTAPLEWVEAVFIGNGPVGLLAMASTPFACLI